MKGKGNVKAPKQGGPVVKMSSSHSATTDGVKKSGAKAKGKKK